MGAKKKTIAALTVADLGLEQLVGQGGSKTQLLSFAPPPVRGKGQVVEAADGPSGAQAIFAFLKEKKLV
jgi:electron transfer flavoprotein alpha/beta subunit